MSVPGIAAADADWPIYGQGFRVCARQSAIYRLIEPCGFGFDVNGFFTTMGEVNRMPQAMVGVRASPLKTGGRIPTVTCSVTMGS